MLSADTQAAVNAVLNYDWWSERRTAFLVRWNEIQIKNNFKQIREWFLSREEE